MTQLQFGIGLVAWVLAQSLPLTAGAQEQDDAAIRQLEASQAAAWNRHDAHAYASHFTEDGDAVNPAGRWWRGRPEIERKLREDFDVAFARSTLTITDVDVRYLDANTAVAHVRWTMTGAKAAPNRPEPREGIQLQVLTKQAGGWLIASCQNTTSVSAPPPQPPAPCYHCLASSMIRDASGAA